MKPIHLVAALGLLFMSAAAPILVAQPFLGVRVGFAISDSQPGIDRTGPMNWIARNPQDVNEVFAASVAGGLWRSVDSGNHWVPVRSLPPWRVSAVAYVFDGTPGGAILATTQDDFRVPSGAGVWRSDDHGGTWRQVASVPGDCSVPPSAYGMAVADGLVVYVATSCGVLVGRGGSLFVKIPASRFPAGAFTPPVTEQFFGVEVTNSGDALVGGDAGLFLGDEFGFDEVAGPPAGGFITSMRLGESGMRRVFAVTPSRRYPNFVVALHGTRGSFRMVISRDFGAHFEDVASGATNSAGNAGGSPFVRIVPSAAGNEDLFVYFGNAFGLSRAGPFRGGDLGSLATDSGRTWESIELGHPDIHDLDFRSVPGEALTARNLLLATDGGLEICRFSGAADALPKCRESYVLGVDRGLSPIQVMNLKGQVIGSGESRLRRLYMDTWHTDRWVSPDNGVNWTRVAGEAAALEMERRVSDPSAAQIISNYNPTPYYLSDDLMANETVFPDVAGAVSGPVMIRRGAFVEISQNATMTLLSMTPNLARASVATPGWTTVGTWQVCVSGGSCFPLAPRGAPIFGGFSGPDGSRVTIYQLHANGLAVLRGTFSFADGSSVIRGAGVTYSTMPTATGPGSSSSVRPGYVATPLAGFSFLPVLSVDPLWPSHLVTPDRTTGLVMRSINGGSNWLPISDISNLITRDASGNPSFTGNKVDDRRTLVSVVSFFPEDPNLVLLGTLENGLFMSLDRGATWRRIPNTEHITTPLSVYWKSANAVLVGSWGRGVFEVHMRYTLPPSSLGLICKGCESLLVGPRLMPAGAAPSFDGTNPLPTSIQENFDEAVLVLDGRINGAEVKGGRLEKLFMTVGSSEYRFAAQDSQLDFQTEEVSGFAGFRGGLPGAAKLRGKGYVVKGLTFANGTVNQIIYGLDETPIPAPEDPGPDVLPQDKASLVSSPYLTMFGPNMRLQNIQAGKPFSVAGFVFQANLPGEILIDGSPLAKFQTDKDGHFEVQLTSPGVLGSYVIVARQVLQNELVETAIDLLVNNGDEKEDGGKRGPRAR